MLTIFRDVIIVENAENTEAKLYLAWVFKIWPSDMRGGGGQFGLLQISKLDYMICWTMIDHLRSITKRFKLSKSSIGPKLEKFNGIKQQLIFFAVSKWNIELFSTFTYSKQFAITCYFFRKSPWSSKFSPINLEGVVEISTPDLAWFGEAQFDLLTISSETIWNDTLKLKCM